MSLRLMATIAASALFLSGKTNHAPICELTPPAGSFEEESAVAARKHAQILTKVHGAYDNPYLSSYVTRVGERVAKASRMPD
ncbi:hypothetical protein CLV78_11827 [Aliiruegeria haliotis]|uniref:Uncharacterized protein n=1 Tax=Aliiruegeria haliotis TaxID=1280846 RepID=A0A2T0RF08_9RHOB|nr:hypothetical protein [Aliiruegeria haliotis]PRY19784.1 hypothetical protein CLV78_11827 [Aliiruegeria haliotis]